MQNETVRERMLRRSQTSAKATSERPESTMRDNAPMSPPPLYQALGRVVPPVCSVGTGNGGKRHK